MEKIKLNNGVEMPMIGLGTFMMSPEDAEVAVRESLKIGYRLVDTANMYVNEKAVGRGIKESGVPREEIFISTKLWISEYENENAVDETLDRLGVDYIDLLFIHRPVGNYKNGYRLLEKAYKEGKIKAIGISNCEGKYLDEILDFCEIKPQVIQVESHPYYTQAELRKELSKNDIKLMSWYPLGHGDKNLINESIFTELAEKYGKSNVQIILRWHIQMESIVIPGTIHVEHMKDNFDLFDFELTQEDMQKIATINKNKRYYYNNDEMLDKWTTMKPEYEK